MRVLLSVLLFLLPVMVSAEPPPLPLSLPLPLPFWRGFGQIRGDVPVSVIRLAESTLDTNIGLAMNGTLRVVIATNQPVLTNGLSVSCISGCSGAAPFADAAAFTFGTTNIALLGAVVDDASTNLVPENGAGIPRMNGSRVMYFDLSQTAANAVAIKTDGSAVVQPVSGTFWQATQPVSGPLTDVQLRATPVPISGTVAANAGSGTFLVGDGAGALTVDGTISTAPPANATTNLAQVAGTTTDTNSGVKSAGTIRVVLATDQPALTNKLLVTPDSVALPANQSVNLNQVAGAAVTTGNGTAAGAQRVSIASDSTGTTIATQATAANLNVREDTSGAVGSAVPARADYLGLNDGTNVVGNKAASAANLATALVSGVQLAVPAATWCVQHTPAAATKATISQAAGAAGVRHYALFYSACFAAGATAGPVQTFAIRDGATGAGTIKWSGALAVPVNGSTCSQGSVGILGTAATAMTIEFAAAGAATTIQTVSLCGMDVS